MNIMDLENLDINSSNSEKINKLIHQNEKIIELLENLNKKLDLIFDKKNFDNFDEFYPQEPEYLKFYC